MLDDPCVYSTGQMRVTRCSVVRLHLLIFQVSSPFLCPSICVASFVTLDQQNISVHNFFPNSIKLGWQKKIYNKKELPPKIINEAKSLLTCAQKMPVEVHLWERLHWVQKDSSFEIATLFPSLYREWKRAQFQNGIFFTYLVLALTFW